MTHEMKCPPAANPRGLQTGESLTASVSTPSAERLARQFDGALVVVVATPGDRYRRRVFLTVAAAQNHAEKARARGYFARVFLAQLDPVTEVRA